MKLERLLYSNRLEPVAAAIYGGLSFRLSSIWQYRDRRQMLLVIGMFFLLFVGICNAIATGIKHSQTSFFERHASIINLELPENKTKTVKPTRHKPLTTVHSIPVEPVPTAPVAPTSLPPYFDVGDPLTEAQALGRSMNAARFGDQHWNALYKLWHAESGWNPAARNRSSGACGIPQALPCRKIPDQSLKGQLEWGISYIAERYGNPSIAWAFWQRHHWY